MLKKLLLFIVKCYLFLLQAAVALVAFTCIFISGFHWTSLLFIAAGILMLPIPKIRKYFNSKNIKTWMIVVASVVFLFTGILNSDSYETNYTSDLDKTSETIESKDKSKNKEKQSDTEKNKKSESKDEEKIEEAISTVKFTLSDIPDYSGNTYVVLNNNIPSFTKSELKTKGYEIYSSLDNLGRTKTAIASVGKDTMPKDNEKRGSISSIKPSGWVQAQYEHISGKYLYNRCHLIGWQLTPENANKKNLITGTKSFNVNGMLPFENMVADYIKETEHHVAYRITPFYKDNNLVCTGVQMEAYSVEDNGQGIQFNVFVYNVEKDVVIDYATGKSYSTYVQTTSTNNGETANNNTSSTTTSSTTSSTSSTTDSGSMVWIPNSGSKYHSRSNCSNMKNPAQVTKSEAISRGYEPCKKCY